MGLDITDVFNERNAADKACKAGNAAAAAMHAARAMSALRVMWYDYCDLPAAMQRQREAKDTMEAAMIYVKQATADAYAASKVGA